jgi:hypothetical protein
MPVNILSGQQSNESRSDSPANSYEFQAGIYNKGKAHI